MIAFLKRRWILASCATVLLAFCFLDAFHEKAVTRRHSGFGVLSGEIEYVDYIFNPAPDGWQERFNEYNHIGLTYRAKREFHAPTFGRTTLVSWSASEKHIRIPLWLPLSAILGWIVIRELRWRENRAPALISFLKRRWVLLSYGVLLTACCAVSVGHEWSDSITSGRVGLLDGNFNFDVQTEGRTQQGSFDWSFAHSPCFGELPDLYFGADYFGVVIPLWLPLAVVLGWIVIRELRWREKQSTPLTTFPT